MNPENPYVAPQTAELSSAVSAEALALDDRDFRTFCLGAAILFWCCSPLAFFLNPLVKPPLGLLLFLVNELCFLLGTFLVMCVPLPGSVRFFARAAFAFQFLLLLTTAGAFFSSEGQISDAFVTAWLCCKCLSLASLLRLITLLGLELDCNTMQRLGKASLGFLTVTIIFAVTAWATSKNIDSIQHQQSGYYALFAGLAAYATSWGAIFCAWWLPEEIIAQMRRCRPNSAARPNHTDFAFLQEPRAAHQPRGAGDLPEGPTP